MTQEIRIKEKIADYYFYFCAGDDHVSHLICSKQRIFVLYIKLVVLCYLLKKLNFVVFICFTFVSFHMKF